MHNSKRKAFTLVELIVVIVILAILATIAFLSFSSQSASARDSTRLSDMSNIVKGLSVFNATSGNYPNPDNAVVISASGITIGKQGYAGSSVLNMIKISNGGKDPLDNSTYYTYSVNAAQNKFQILGFLEDSGNSALSIGDQTLRLSAFGYQPLAKTFADPASYSGRYVMAKGDALGILLDGATKVPVQASKANIDLRLTNISTVYNVIFGSENTNTNVIGSGSIVLSNIINKSDDLIFNKALVATDESLVGYWDMETLTADGLKLKDLSGYGNNGTCYNGATSGTCGITGPQIVDGNGKTGKAMNFDGIDDYINIGKPSILNVLGSFTVIAKVKPSSNIAGEIGFVGKYGTSGYAWALRTLTGKFVFTTDYSNGTDINLSSSSQVLGGKYYNLGGIFDNLNKKSFIYINGVLENSVSSPITSFNNSSNVILGGQDRSGYYFSGAIDEVRIYNRILSDSEISNLYNATK